MDFNDALNTVTAELTPQPWDYTTPDGVTLTVIPACLPHAEPGTAEVYLRVTRDKTHAAEAAITTTDLPNLIAALDSPITEHWEHQPHYPDGTEKGRIGTWLGGDYGLALNPMRDGFSVTAIEETDAGVVAATLVVPEAQRLPLASPLRRAMDVARGWEDWPAMASHFLDCLTMQWYALPTSPCTCPPWVGLDPDGWYRLDCSDPADPRIVEYGDEDRADEAPLALDDAIHELQAWEQQDDRT